MTLTSSWKRLLCEPGTPNSGSGGGGGGSTPSGGGSASGGAAPASGGSAAGGSQPSGGSGSTPVVPASPAAEKNPANAFVNLAKKAGFTPAHATAPKAPTAERTLSIGEDADLLGDNDKIIATTDKTKVAPVEVVQLESEVPDDGEGKLEDDEQPPKETPTDKGENKEKPDEQPPKPKAYDINSLEPEDRPFAKKMHNSAVEHFDRKIKGLRAEIASREAQLKKVEEGGLPLSYYNHPEAYNLHPEYRKAQANVNNIQREAQFWQKQLVAIENNQPFRVIEGYDEQGREIVKGPFQPSAEAKVALQDALYQVNGALSQERARIAQLQQGFKSEYDKSATAVEQAVQQKIGPLLSPEADKIVIGNKPLGELSKQFLSEVPEAYRDHPMTKACVALFRAFQVLGAENVKLRGAAQQQTAINRTTQLAEVPNSQTVTPTTPRNGVKNVRIGGRTVQDTEFKFDPNTL